MVKIACVITLWSTYYVPVTHLLPYYTPITHLLRTYYPITHLLRTYYAPVTRLLRIFNCIKTIFRLSHLAEKSERSWVMIRENILRTYYAPITILRTYYDLLCNCYAPITHLLWRLRRCYAVFFLIAQVPNGGP